MKRIVLPILEIAFCLLLVSSLIVKASGHDNFFTLQGLLDLVSNCPSIPFMTIDIFNISGDWGIFEFLRNFFNSLGAVFTFSVNICIQIVNTFIFIFYFLRNLFTGALVS